jgi:hypothetical protein
MSSSSQHKGHICSDWKGQDERERTSVRLHCEIHSNTSQHHLRQQRHQNSWRISVHQPSTGQRGIHSISDFLWRHWYALDSSITAALKETHIVHLHNPELIRIAFIPLSCFGCDKENQRRRRTTYDSRIHLDVRMLGPVRKLVELLRSFVGCHQDSIPSKPTQ